MFFADLHCDLLFYLAQKKGATATDEECRCSSTLLKKGKVALQTLAIYSETSAHSVESAKSQCEIFASLPSKYPNDFVRLNKLEIPKDKSKVSLIAAIENASCLCGENEHLKAGFTRLDSYIEKAGPLLYISLTWNHENRFGGGNLTHVGLKRDGELLLEYLNKKNIAIDFSHTSDALAHDILNYITKKNLSLTPIASHSNFRTISNQPRNLIDEIAKEIAARGGVIGLNFVTAFIGKDIPGDFIRQIEYAHRLGLGNHLTLGADFFYDKEVPASISPFFPFFYEPFGNSGCYPDFFQLLSKKFTKNDLERIAYKNLENCFKSMLSKNVERTT